MRPAAWTSYVAIGDSFTEGLDDFRADGTPRGWADRVAERLALDSPQLRYANLAVRGKMLDQVVADQVPVAERLLPDLITFSAGGNDIIRPHCDPDSVAARFEAALARLVDTGAEVVIFIGFDVRRVPVLRHLRGRVATFNELLRGVAERQRCRAVDLWSMAPLSDPRCWGADRLHLTAAGHRLVALRTLEVLGVPVTENWRDPWPAAEPHPWLHRRQQDLSWARQYMLPYLYGRARGRRTGDGFLPKRPELAPLEITSGGATRAAGQPADASAR